jgi:hypothetical protein
MLFIAYESYEPMARLNKSLQALGVAVETISRNNSSKSHFAYSINPQPRIAHSTLHPLVLVTMDSEGCLHHDFECVCFVDPIDRNGTICFSSFEELHIPDLALDGCLLRAPVLGRNRIFQWKAGQGTHHAWRMVDQVFLHDHFHGNIALLPGVRDGVPLSPSELTEVQQALLHCPEPIDATYFVSFEVLPLFTSLRR